MIEVTGKFVNQIGKIDFAALLCFWIKYKILLRVQKEVFFSNFFIFLITFC